MHERKKWMNELLCFVNGNSHLRVSHSLLYINYRGAYVDGDPRYHRQKFKTNDQREQVVLWTEKEYRNLIRAHRAGVAVPTPLHQKENILFMRFLGENGWPSPQLKEIDMRKGSKKWTTLYCQTLVAVRRYVNILHRVSIRFIVLFHAHSSTGSYQYLNETGSIIAPDWSMQILANTTCLFAHSGKQHRVIWLVLGSALAMMRL